MLVLLGRDGVLDEERAVWLKVLAELDPLTQGDSLVDVVKQLDLVAEIGCHAPWAHPRAAELDRVSFGHWLRQESADEEACQNISMFIAGAMLTKPEHSFSTLQAVLMAASAGSFTHLTDEDFILDRRVVGGMQSARSLRHYAEIFRLADQANVLDDPDLATSRMKGLLSIYGI